MRTKNRNSNADKDGDKTQTGKLEEALSHGQSISITMDLMIAWYSISLLALLVMFLVMSCPCLFQHVLPCPIDDLCILGSLKDKVDDGPSILEGSSLSEVSSILGVISWPFKMLAQAVAFGLDSVLGAVWLLAQVFPFIGDDTYYREADESVEELMRDNSYPYLHIYIGRQRHSGACQGILADFLKVIGQYPDSCRR